MTRRSRLDSHVGIEEDFAPAPPKSPRMLRLRPREFCEIVQRISVGFTDCQTNFEMILTPSRSCSDELPDL